MDFNLFYTILMLKCFCTFAFGKAVAKGKTRRLVLFSALVRNCTFVFFIRIIVLFSSAWEYS